ncbi:MAG: hypothetical protein IT172_00480 [Acidobacteria bacterium]|nr:hypothetical protein [Acidobacteriota bacterium]
MMPRKCPHRWVLALVGVLFAAASAFGQSGGGAAADEVDGVFLAKGDGHGHAGEIVSRFRTDDVPIYCVVQLRESSKATVKMQLSAVKVPGVAAEKPIITSSYTLKEGEDRVTFNGRPQGDWLAGEYRIEIFVNEKSRRKVDFEIYAVERTPPEKNDSVSAAPVKRSARQRTKGSKQ